MFERLMPLKDEYSILIHPGFAKAMTTFMQDVVFSSHSQINHIGRQYWSDHLPASVCYHSADLIRYITGRDSIDYDDFLAESVFGNLKHQRFNKGYLNTISDESLTYACNADRKIIAMRLKKLMPNAKILFTIRSQYTLLVSAFFWLRYTKLAIPNKFHKWLSSSNLIYNDIYDDFFLRQYRYCEVIEEYSQLFGKDNILIVPVESIAVDKDTVCKKIESNIGIDSRELAQIFRTKPVNVRPSIMSIYYVRFYSQLRWFLGRQTAARDIISYGDGINKKIISLFNRIYPHRKLELDDNSYEFITNYYSKSNKELAVNYNLELEKYGYPLR